MPCSGCSALHRVNPNFLKKRSAHLFRTILLIGFNFAQNQINAKIPVTEVEVMALHIGLYQ